MPTPLDEFMQYLRAGAQDLSSGEKEDIARQTGARSFNGSIDELAGRIASRGRLHTKVELIVRGLKASGMEKDELWQKWGHLLWKAYAENLSNGTDVGTELGKYNGELLRDISSGYAEAAHLAHQAMRELGLPAAIAEEAIESEQALNHTLFMPTMYGPVRLVRREEAGAFCDAIKEFAQEKRSESSSAARNPEKQGGEEQAGSSRAEGRARPYLKRLEGIAMQAAQELPKSQGQATLAWDKEAVEKGILLEDVITSFAIKQPQELNPVEQAALVAYAMQESKAPAKEKLAMLTEALYLYRIIDGMTGGYRQRETVLRFFRNDAARLIRDAGYRPLEEGLREIIGEELASDETEFLAARIRSRMPDSAAEFYTETGAGEYLKENDENMNAAIASVASETLPRLIEKRGYRRLAELVREALPEKLEGKKLREAQEALMEDADVVSHSEELDTIDGRIMYVAPEMQEAVSETTSQKASWYGLSARQKRRIAKEEELQAALKHTVFASVHEIEDALSSAYKGNTRINHVVLRSANQMERQLPSLDGRVRELVAAELGSMIRNYRDVGKKRGFSTSWNRVKELRDEYRGGLAYRMKGLLARR